MNEIIPIKIVYYVYYNKMNKMIIEQCQAKTKNRLVFQHINPEIIQATPQNNIQTPIKHSTFNHKVNLSYNQLNESPLIVPPYQNEEGQNDNVNDIDMNDQPKEATKRKKDWKSWSSEEKVLFYEIIANGGNFSSLQKLFKTMNDKIGTKSTEKIRDFYYRMLKKVNTLLKSAGELGLNSKNRDEVILAIKCYGKLLTTSTKKSKFDMKKLNKHPRRFKQIANTLKKLITKQIKMVRTKKINNLSNSGNKSTRSKIVPKNTMNNNHTLLRQGKPMMTNTNNDASDFSRIINVTAFRKIPYESFILRLTPYDKETYLKMIEENYCSRLEINVSMTKPIKHIIDVLTEKWKSIQKNYSKHILYLIPIEEIWIPNELTFFSTLDSGKSYDMGDIYTAYGAPSTNMLYMYYQWGEGKNETKQKTEGTNGNMLGNVLIGLDDNNQLTSDIHRMNNGENPNSNCAIKNEYSYEDDLPKEDEDDVEEDEDDDDQEQDKSFMPLESDLNIFDPLEFLSYEDDKKNLSEDEEGNYNSDYSSKGNQFKNKNIFISTKSPHNKKQCKPEETESIHNNNNINNLGTSTSNLNNYNNNNSKLRTGYSEMFSQSDCGLLIGVNQKSTQSLTNNITSKATTKKKIPFSNNVNKNEVIGSENFISSQSNTQYVNKTINDKNKDIGLDNAKEQLIGEKGKIKETDKTNNIESPSPKNKLKSSPKKRIEPILINKNSMMMNQSSNFGLTALIQPDQNTRMMNNTMNMSLYNNDYNNAENNYINQNSANFNSIFEYGNNNTNMEFFRNNNYNTSNIFKIDYPNVNSNHYPYINNNNLPNHTISNPHDHFKDESQDIPIKEVKEEFINKKTKRTKEKKKPDKITIEEIEESEKKQRQRKQKNTSSNNTSSKVSSSCIINQNNYFTNYPGQYYGHPQMQMNIDIPLPSKFLEEKRQDK